MSASRPRRNARTTTTIALWIAVIGLGILHQDFWLWDDRTMVFGFLPSGLAYHAAFSLAAAALWALAVCFAWPQHIEEWADEPAAPIAPRDEPPTGART